MLLPWDGLTRNDPQRLIQTGGLVIRERCYLTVIRSSGLIGNVSLGVGFGVFKSSSQAQCFSLPAVCGSGCRTLKLLLQHSLSGAAMLPIMTIMD